jgi:AcrR family transcriptional regulator
MATSAQKVTQGASRRTQAERREAAANALFGAAVRLFARNGVDTTSLADIGADAGFSRGLANHHFGSRAALVEQLAERVQRSFTEQLSTDLGGVEAIVDTVDRYLHAVEDDPTQTVAAFMVMWGASFASDAALRPVFAAGDQRSRSDISAMIRRGQEEIRPDADADAFSTALLALLRGVSAQFLVAPDAVDIDATRRLIDTLVHSYLDPEQT